MKATVAQDRGTGQRRLILVSNRLPLSFKRENGELQAVPSSGGGVLDSLKKSDEQQNQPALSAPEAPRSQ